MLTGATSGFDSSGVGADETTPAELTPEQKEREKLLQRMKQRAAGIEVQITTDQDQVAAKLVAEPLLRYNDQPRGFRDATVWCWCDNQGRPVALLKTQIGRDRGRSRWLDGLNSLSDRLIEAKWEDGHRFASRQPGMKRIQFADGPEASDKPRVRLQQMKEIADRVSLTIWPSEGGQQEMRLLPRPLYRYTPPAGELIDGALFGFTTNGTNPDAVLAVELTGRDVTKGTWLYGLAQMTTGGLAARIDDREVWTATKKVALETAYDEWIWFWGNFDKDGD
jgi:hypothetical protein